MDELVLINKVQKRLKENLQTIGDSMISGTGVDNHEKYQYMVGQLRAYEAILQEISTLLTNKEPEENETGTVIDINTKK